MDDVEMNAVIELMAEPLIPTQEDIIMEEVSDDEDFIASILENDNFPFVNDSTWRTVGAFHHLYMICQTDS